MCLVFTCSLGEFNLRVLSVILSLLIPHSNTRCGKQGGGKGCGRMSKPVEGASLIYDVMLHFLC